MSWSARIAVRDYRELHEHLHRPDRDEHAAFLFAGEMATPTGPRLLVRRVVPVADEDFGPSDRGAYRQVSPRAITRAAIDCEAEGLRLLWTHSHPGAGRAVSFSSDDRATHERAHPHLIDMTGGRPVASLVFGTDSVAGEVWAPDGSVHDLDHLDVVGAHWQRLTPIPRSATAATATATERFDRQVLMFGEAGQATLRAMTVAVVGAGGGGSLLVQSLAHLGVGRIIVIDFDRVDITNLSRIVGTRPSDAQRHRRKIDVARRLVRSVDPTIEVVAAAADVTYTNDARMLLDADYIFSATDTHFARFAVNAVCHQYLIPGAQVGAKVVADPDGAIELAYAMHRPLDLDGACLECAGAIDPEGLRREQLNKAERRDQDYLQLRSPGSALADPAVITLNSASVALAMLDFQFSVTGMFPAATTLHQRLYHAPERELRDREAHRAAGCRWCDRETSDGAFARGDDLPLPLRPGTSPERSARGWVSRLLARMRRS